MCIQGPRLTRLIVRRWSARLQPSPGRGCAHAQRRRNCLGGQAAQVQAMEFLVARTPLAPALRPLSGGLGAVSRWCCRFPIGTLLIRHCPRCLTDGTAAAVDGTSHGFAKIVRQMPAIRDLPGPWRAPAGSLGVSAGTIACDHLDARMPAQPGCDGLGAAVGQKIDDLSALKIAHDGPVTLPTPPRPVVNTGHAWRRVCLHFRCPDQAQQRIATDRHRQPGGEP